ncbi:MAG TPA: hypothetical protein VNI34_08805 [Candidatus Nitrosotalea sp.]|nr:hypothetical protein [Candidatus Nitrosotalea sp.]
MAYLSGGEWWEATVFMGCSFVFAAVGAVGLGWWVIRGDRRNRAATLSSDPIVEHQGH